MEHKTKTGTYRKNESGNSVLVLCVIVFFVGLVAIAGLIVGVVVWMGSGRLDADVVLITVNPDGGGQPTARYHPGLTEQPPPPTNAPEEGCLRRRTTVNCSPDACSQKYRTYDGTCNNRNNPLWGASETPYKRLLKPIYEDGRNTPVGWNPSKRYNLYTKPSARLVSQEVLTTPGITTNDKFTDLVMVWGQYLDHDTDQTPKTDSLCTETCTQKSPYCFPIFAPENDARLAKDGCIALTRSTPVCGLETREQLNSITSYIDASMVYGSTTERAINLRDFTGESGRLRVGITVDAGGKLSKPLMPFVNKFPQGCNRPRQDDSGIPCFFAGDVRANEHLGLIALHTLWVREHNRIADELKRLNPQWNGEKLYQETRKIIGALHQIISYDYWLPIIVGSKGMELLGEYVGYDPTVDASVINGFATAIFRFGHAQVSPTVFRLRSDFQEASHGNLWLREAAFCPFRVVNEGSIDNIVRGMFASPLKEINPQSIMSEAVTESLFGLARAVAHDLASLNIQRGRDHGLPGYNDWREVAGLPVADTFDDLARDILDARLRQKLQDLYGHPSNVDLFVAGLVEDPWHDSLLGPTFTWHIIKQFQQLRTGDRFWYENPKVFTSNQLLELKKHSLARVFCDSGDDIQHVQPDVFEQAIYPDGYKPCDQITGMDLTAWKDVGIDNACN